MIGEKGDNRSVAKLYFLIILTAAQFLLIETPLFFVCITTNIISVIYLIFFSDEFFRLKSNFDSEQNSVDFVEYRNKSDNNQKNYFLIKIIRKVFLYSNILSHIIIFYFVWISIANYLDITDIGFRGITLEGLYGPLLLSFGFWSPVISEHFMDILNEEKPRR